jgi:hypothetical protein
VKLASKVPARAGDAEELISKKALDEEHGGDVVGSIAALSALSPHRLEKRGELALPIAKRVNLDARDATGDADADRLVCP